MLQLFVVLNIEDAFLKLFSWTLFLFGQHKDFLFMHFDHNLIQNNTGDVMFFKKKSELTL